MPHLFSCSGDRQILLLRLDLDREFSEVAHSELELALVLDEDLQGVLDAEELVLCRVGEYLDHVAKLRMQLVHDTELGLHAWHWELDRPRLSDFLSAARILVCFNVLLNGEKRLALHLLPRHAIDDTLKLYFERLHSLLALAVVMINIHADFLTWCENKLFKRDHRRCLRCTQATNAAYLALEGSLEFRVGCRHSKADLSQF